MWECFFPDSRAASAYEINYEAYYEKGYRGILFDIDNTLVEHGKDATRRAIDLLERLQKIGFAIALISNNKKERVYRFNRRIDAEVVWKAGKPGKKGYLLAMKKMHTTEQTTLLVGDQLFTDVWGAKRLGIRNVLVNPIDKNEEIQIVLKRYLERIVLKAYEKQSGLERTTK
ncbi:MAG: YqeG family HAD IIIA-type phosphatase [Eubacterium sp.]